MALKAFIIQGKAWLLRGFLFWRASEEASEEVSADLEPAELQAESKTKELCQAPNKSPEK